MGQDEKQQRAEVLQYDDETLDRILDAEIDAQTIEDEKNRELPRVSLERVFKDKTASMVRLLEGLSTQMICLPDLCRELGIEEESAAVSAVPYRYITTILPTDIEKFDLDLYTATTNVVDPLTEDTDFITYEGAYWLIQYLPDMKGLIAHWLVELDNSRLQIIIEEQARETNTSTEGEEHGKH